MADEARAMLDALMGSDRNASLPSGAADPDHHDAPPTGGPGPGHRRKRSCYDPAVCPLYCAWGTDLHELFTNTKSDIGPNPRICDDDARQEYLSLPPHEQERLGFDYLLYDRLRDLVRGCDRIVNRNKDKLRQEVARQQRARNAGSGGGNAARVNGDDPAANISEDKVRKVAEDRARLELIEEEIGGMVQELEGLDEEEQKIAVEAVAASLTSSSGAVGDNAKTEAEAEAKAAAKADTEGAEKVEEATTDTNANAQSEEDSKEEKKEDGPTTSEEKAENETNSKETADAKEEEENTSAKPSSSESLVDDDDDDGSKAKLAEIRSQKRSILAALSSRMEQILPLREAIESDTRHLHHFRSNHTIDKCVCEVSGNFMSFRDADERIAAHYAGKQYVGWKMVRDKLDELRKKFGSGGPPPPRGPPPGYGPPSSRGGGGGGGGGGYRDEHRRGGGGGGGRRRDRSRSRERNRDRDRHRGGGGRRRSPDRWERDRGPRDWDRGRGGGRRDRW